MLADIRERAGRYVVGGILVLLIIPFALWGIGSYFQPTASAAVARVGDLDISRAELQRATRDTTERYRELLGERFRADVIDPAAIQRQTLDELVTQKLLQLDAGERGLAISDAALFATIAANPSFAGDKGFDTERYRKLLGAQGYTPKTFEARVREALLSEQLRRGIAESAWISDAELDAIARLWFETRDLGVAVVPKSAFAPSSPPTDAAIQDFYIKHAQDFRTAQQVRVAYVSLDRAQLLAATTADPSAISTYYDEHLGQYTTPERRALSHILVVVPKDAAPEQVLAAQKQIQTLKTQLDAGADFADLARRHSQDPGSAPTGGDLGSYTRGALEIPLDQAAFALAAGTVSEPVRSSFGWHLLRVGRITPAQVQPLAAVSDQIAHQLREIRADELLHQRVEDLRRVAFEQPDTLEPAAEAVGAKIEQTGMFARDSGTGIAANSAFVAAAFGDPVLVEGVNSDVIELEPGRYAVLRMVDHAPARALPMDQVRTEISARLANAEAAQGARAGGQKIAEQLSGGTARDAITAPVPLSWKMAAGIARDTRDTFDPAVLNAAFRLKRPGAGKTTYDGVPLANGDYAIIAVTGVGSDPRAKDPEQRKALREALLRARTEAALNGYLKQLRATTPVKVYAQQAD